jgi:dTDP-4-amino-4,6-dideoxygalactose transaminase
MDNIFNKPYFNNKCLENIKKTYEKGCQSGDGFFTKKCKNFFLKKYNFKNVFLTPSCTHSLEMMAMLINIKKDDEVIIPSYTFVSNTYFFKKWNPFIFYMSKN